jgi:hypothetical protein
MVSTFGPHYDLADRQTDDPIVLEDSIHSANLLYLVELLKSSRKIVVVSGSGISMSAGCKILSLSRSLQILIIFSSQFPMFTKADRSRLCTPFIAREECEVLLCDQQPVQPPEGRFHPTNAIPWAHARARE